MRLIGSQPIRTGSGSDRVIFGAGVPARAARLGCWQAHQNLSAKLDVWTKFEDLGVGVQIFEHLLRVLAVVDTVMAITPDLFEPAVLKWIEVGDEGNWDQVRPIFEPSADKLRSAGLDAAVMIRRGSPKDKVVEEAESWGADCIFVGAKSVRGIDRLLLGSVSSAVSARAHCSVEVVRPKSTASMRT